MALAVGQRLRAQTPLPLPLPEKDGPGRSLRHSCPPARPPPFRPGTLTAEVVEAGEIHDLSPKSHGGIPPAPPATAAPPAASCTIDGGSGQHSGKQRPQANRLRAGSGHCRRSAAARRRALLPGGGGLCLALRGRTGRRWS